MRMVCSSAVDLVKAEAHQVVAAVVVHPSRQTAVLVALMLHSQLGAAMAFPVVVVALVQEEVDHQEEDHLAVEADQEVQDHPALKGSTTRGGWHHHRGRQTKA